MDRILFILLDVRCSYKDRNEGPSTEIFFSLDDNLCFLGSGQLSNRFLVHINTILRCYARSVFHDELCRYVKHTERFSISDFALSHLLSPGNCMSTDLITIEDPIVIKTYDDIIDKKIVTAFTQASPEYGVFASAKPGTKEAQMFANKVEFTPGLGDSSRFASITYNQKGVIVIRKPVAQAVAMFYLWYFGQTPPFNENPNIRFLVKIDKENSKRYNNVFIISGKLRNTRKYKAMNRLYV